MIKDKLLILKLEYVLRLAVDVLKLRAEELRARGDHPGHTENVIRQAEMILEEIKENK